MNNVWDEELCRILDIPMSLLPEVKDSSDDFGTTKADLLGLDEVPILGVAGDPAGGYRWAGLFQAGYGEINLRHGLFRIDEYRRYACSFEEQNADDDRLSPEWSDDLRSRGVDLRGWRSGAMVAGRARF